MQKSDPLSPLTELLRSRPQRPGTAEAAACERMLALAHCRPDCLLRSCFEPGHFTASGLVVSADGGRVLLHHHRFLDRWLQFGGHCDGDPDLVRVACREAREESGIEGLVVASRRPFDLDIHAIPPNPRRGEPEHLHFDVRFMLIAPESAPVECSEESRELRWFTPDEARAITPEGSMHRLFDKWELIRRLRGAAGGN